jgi:hypothetical protein
MKKLLNWFTTIFQSELPNVPPRPPAPPPQLNSLRASLFSIKPIKYEAIQIHVKPLKFEVEADVEEIAKANAAATVNASLQKKYAHNQYLASKTRVDELRWKILELLTQDSDLQSNLEALQALTLAQHHITDQLIRKTTSTEVK